MTVSRFIRPALACGALVALGLGFAGAAPAQTEQGGAYGGDAYGGSDITVRATPLPQRDGATGAEIDLVASSRVVSYGDLDLSSPEGVQVLRSRVERAAFDACNDLSSRYVIVQDDTSACIRDATRNAMYRAPIGYGMDGLRD